MFSPHSTFKNIKLLIKFDISLKKKLNMPTFRITKGAVNYPTPPNYYSLISILILLFHFSIIAKLSS